MKLQTEIKPRRDGTVIATGQSGARYVFRANEAGDLVCEVASAADVAHLVGNELFWPADPKDYDAALALSAVDSEDDDGDDDGDDDLTDEEMAGALPIEANTPPVRRKPGPKPKAKV